MTRATINIENNEISRHEVVICLAIKASGPKWLTNKEIAALVAPVALRTVCNHTLKLANLGLIDQAEVFPGHRFRWSEMGAKRNFGYAKRLENAVSIFGLDVVS